MSKRTHRRQLDRARAKRQQSRALERRRRMVAVVAIVLAALLVLSAAVALRPTPEPEVAVDDPAALSTDPADPEGGTATAADPGSTGTAAGGGAVAPCPAPAGDVPTPAPTLRDAPPTPDLEAATVTATIETTCGTIEVELDAEAAPRTVGNFVGLAEDDYYVGVPFHRVIDGFMIQGGDPTGTGCGREDCTQVDAPSFPGYTFADELGLAEQVVAEAGGYPRGTVAMANAGPDTNGSQFFIVQAEQPYPLEPAYTVFGRVTAGMDVVDRIAQGPTDGDLAADPVRILDIRTDRP